MASFSLRLIENAISDITCPTQPLAIMQKQRLKLITIKVFHYDLRLLKSSRVGLAIAAICR